MHCRALELYWSANRVASYRPQVLLFKDSAIVFGAEESVFLRSQLLNANPRLPPGLHMRIGMLKGGHEQPRAQFALRGSSCCGVSRAGYSASEAGSSIEFSRCSRRLSATGKGLRIQSSRSETRRCTGNDSSRSRGPGRHPYPHTLSANRGCCANGSARMYLTVLASH